MPCRTRHASAAVTEQPLITLQETEKLLSVHKATISASSERTEVGDYGICFDIVAKTHGNIKACFINTTIDKPSVTSLKRFQRGIFVEFT